MKRYMGIDNGVTGTISVLDEDGKVVWWSKTPIRSCSHYSKSGRIMNRINRQELTEIINNTRPDMVILEFPRIDPDPKKILTTVSASMSLEATWSVFEDTGVPHQFISAITWQKVMIGAAADTKKASKDVTKRLHPKLTLPPGADGDAVLICEYARRMNL